MKASSPTPVETGRGTGKPMTPIAVVPFLVALGSGLPARVDLYVATSGNDAWSGTLPAANPDKTDGPFATPERARDEIRKRKASQSGPTTVHIRGGRYHRERAFTLTAEDGGSTDAPITYRAYESETVRWIGGKAVTGWKVTDDPDAVRRLAPPARGKVVQADLRALGITDFGQVPRGGMELFFRDEPSKLARWPNEGFVRIKDVTKQSLYKSHGREGSKVGNFYFEEDRPKQWSGEEDIWLHGYWFWDWRDAFQKVESIDAEKQLISLVPPHHGYGYRKGARYYALNALAELDEPGEWQVNRKAGILYFWPPEPVEQGSPIVSVLATLVETKEASHVTFRGLTLEAIRGTAVKVIGGTHTRVVGCVIRNTGSNAVALSGGTSNAVIGCDIYNTASGGVSLGGGNRKKLTPGGNLVENNHIHHYSRWVRTYSPAVGVSGVGNRIRHNLIHDAPHNAIQLGGNQHVIEFNEIHHVCLETDDVGAFYMGRDWTMRENVIRHNYFHHLGRHGGGVGVMAIYFDDWASGNTAYGNVCYKAGRAVLIGGGRDTTIENNIFVDCTPAVHVDARGLGWAKYYFDGTTTTLTDRLEAMNYREPPYSTRYPELLKLYDDEPAVAKGNRIVRNICVGGRWLDLANGLTTDIVHVKDNLLDADPRFVNREKEDFRLKDDSPAYKLGFKPIPFEKIGLYEDERRASSRPSH